VLAIVTARGGLVHRRLVAQFAAIAVGVVLVAPMVPAASLANSSQRPAAPLTPSTDGPSARVAASLPKAPGPGTAVHAVQARHNVIDPAAYDARLGRAVRVVGQSSPIPKPSATTAPANPTPAPPAPDGASPDSTPSPTAVSPLITGSKIYGTVKNQAGSVLPGIVVTLTPQFSGSPYTATTNSAGAFVASVRGGGEWYVVKYHDPKGTYFDGYYGGGGLTTGIGPTPVISMYSTPRTANATMRLAFHITGHVQDQANAPIADIEVAVYTTGQTFVDFATTDSNGDYAITVSAGSYYIYEGDGLHDVARGCWSPSGPSGVWSTCTVYKITTADIVVDMTVPPPPTVTGHLYAAATGLGEAASLAFLETLDSGAGSASGNADATGAYTVKLQPGRYYMAAGGNVTGYLSRHGWSPDKSEAIQITVTAAGVTGVDLTVPDWGSITGSIEGSPCSTNGIYVDVYDNSGYVTSTQVDYSGHYSVAVPEGTFWLDFFDPTGSCASGWYENGSLVARGSLASPIAVTAAVPGTASVVLPTPRWISGKLSSSNGAALGDPQTVQVWVGSDYYLQTDTLSNGTFSLPVLPGTYKLFVAARGFANGWIYGKTLIYASASATAINVTSANKSVAVTLPTTSVFIHGKVTSAGKAVSGIEVVAYAGNDEAGWTTTDTTGQYWIDLRSGSYSLAEMGSATLLSGVYASGSFSPYWSDRTKVTATSTGATANFAVGAAHRVHGVVRGTAPAGVHDVLAELFDARGLYDYVRTGYGGEFDELLPAHDFRLGFYDATNTWGTAWYSAGGPVRNSQDATTLAMTSDLLDLAITLPPVTVPDPPTGVSGAPFDGGGVVTWSAPANDGWRPITGYTATASPGGANCSSGASDNRCVITGLLDGTPYTFTVTATNMKGTSDASTPSAAMEPNNLPAPPDPVMASGYHLGALLSWTASPGATGYQATSSPGGLTCSTLGETSCVLPGLADGTEYTFTVVASNGNGSGPVSGPSNAVTPALPNAAMTALPATSPITSLMLNWSSPGNQNPATYDVRYRRAPWNGALSGYTSLLSGSAALGATLAVGAGTTYCYSARAHDLGSTTSAWSAETCTAVPLDDRSLSRSSGWSLLANASDYRGTVLRTTTLGAKLTRTGVVAKTLTLVATTCPSCGTVRVYWGTTLLKTISLVSSTTVHRKVFTIAQFSAAKTGTVVIKVSTSGKAVLIDGLGIRRV